MSITRNKKVIKSHKNNVNNTGISLGRLLLYALLVFVIALPYFGIWLCKEWYNVKVKEINYASLILINKDDMTLQLVNYRGELLSSYGIACGKNFGNKAERGDYKTPEGIFRISDIQNATKWKHDFRDGKGEIEGAYGPWFFRLAVPGHKGIGIHGTHKPASIGTRDTEGCIRLNNNDLQELKQYVFIGMTVIILPSLKDLAGSKLLDSLQQEVLLNNNSDKKGTTFTDKDTSKLNKVESESRISRIE